MWTRGLAFLFVALPVISVSAQEKFTTVEDLREKWTIYNDGVYQPAESVWYSRLNTVYFDVDTRADTTRKLLVQSANPYFVFINGKVIGEYEGQTLLSFDSLVRAGYASPSRFAIHQNGINPRDLRTEVVSLRPAGQAADMWATRPYSDFRDFVVIAGMAIIIVFVVMYRLQPKLASDYFSVSGIFSVREVEDGQSASRLTSSSNIQFYILCSLLIGYYLLIIFHNLPSEYALPLRFSSGSFWSATWQWLRISTLVFAVLAVKITVIFSLTRLFGLRGVARFHFFNWIRLLLVVFGTATVFLFSYFISRGSRPDVFVFFLSLVVITLVTWIVVAFLKLSGRTGHSMFHLFSYLCATEIIPLLLTAKVLFQ